MRSLGGWHKSQFFSSPFNLVDYVSVDVTSRYIIRVASHDVHQNSTATVQYTLLNVHKDQYCTWIRPSVEVLHVHQRPGVARASAVWWDKLKFSVQPVTNTSLRQLLLNFYIIWPSNIIILVAVPTYTFTDE